MGTGHSVLAHLQGFDVMTEKTQKILTFEKMQSYLDACSWGDVPDRAHALVAYLVMDGYVLPPTGKLGNRAEAQTDAYAAQRVEKMREYHRAEAQVATYARFYGNAGIPKEPGFYWAFWLTATDATVEKEELVPAIKWEIVEVDFNMMGGDPDHPEYWLVAVPGVQAHQFVGNFMWGPRVPNYKPHPDDFHLKSGPILDRILGASK